MLYNQFAMHRRYDLESPEFQAAFSFLEKENLTELAEGAYSICSGVTAYVQLYMTSPNEKLVFETHRRAFDIQYMVQGLEGIGVIPAENLSEKTDYDPQRDIQYWQEPEYAGMLVLHSGDYAVLPPDMAHKPRISLGGEHPVRKIVIKVPARDTQIPQEGNER